MSYDSKYTGQQVEELLEKAGTALQSVPDEYVTATELEGKGYATAEAVNTSLAEKVDKVAGKQLTTEDFTTALKQKLEGLSNYDDTAISEAVNTLREDFDTLVSGDSTTAIKTFNEIIAFLSGIEDSESLDSIIASIEQQIAGKQDTIADLATIREGAGRGATAVQPSSLAKVATSGSYNDLTDKPTIPAEQVNADWNATSGKARILNKPTIPTVPTKVSELENDAKYITEQTAQQTYQPIGDYALKSELTDNVAYPMESHTEATLEIAPNVMHVWGEMAALTVTLGAEVEGRASEYLFQFSSPATATTLTLPSDLVWANGEALAPEANKTYQVSIVNGYAVYIAFELLPTNRITITNHNSSVTITSEYPVASDISVVMTYTDEDGTARTESVSLYTGKSSLDWIVNYNVSGSISIESITPSVDASYKYIF